MRGLWITLSELRSLAVLAGLFVQNTSHGLQPSQNIDWTFRGLLAIAATGSAAHLDQSTAQKFTELPREGVLDKTFHVAERWGGLVAPAVGFLAYPASWIFSAPKENRWTLRSKRVFYSVAATTALVTGMKFSVGRYRPFQANDPSRFDAFSRKHLSFPSGHTSTAFAFSASLAHEWESWWVKVPLFALSTATALSRIYDRKHWLSDVTAGAIIGIYVADLVENHSQKAPQEYVDFSFQPVLTPAWFGLSLYRLFK